ncbi:MAG TPA: hypothetical protein DDW49_05500 [Deltaproteobacteria bacterium]|nr:MAG: hypothetical protein A2048_06215 [Deltaproteobacteria bacterium GWA2_45_12]HBF12830.1 hypothetical protein [Deltaproteobacteria bacterium]
MTSIYTNNAIGFGVLNQAEQQILRNEAETQKSQKSEIRTKNSFVQKKREERIQNLQDRLKMMSQGHGGCLKALKIIATVAAVVAAPFTGGTTLAIIVAVTAVLNTVATQLEQLKIALQQKNIVLNKAEGAQISAFIEETQKWVEDEKMNLHASKKKETQSLEEYQQTLRDLEHSIQSMIQVAP